MTLTLPADAGAELEFDTGSGRLNSAILLSIRDDDEYVFGNGGAQISVDTTSGSLTLMSR